VTPSRGEWHPDKSKRFSCWFLERVLEKRALLKAEGGEKVSGHHLLRTMTKKFKKGRQFFKERIWWQNQLTHRVTSTLVTPLSLTLTNELPRLSGLCSRCQTFISACNQPAIQANSALHSAVVLLKSTSKQFRFFVIFAADSMVEITSGWLRIRPVPQSPRFSSSRLLWLLSTVRMTKYLQNCLCAWCITIFLLIVLTLWNVSGYILQTTQV